ncbi:DUF3040 domain-containing protein [Streptomyces sp. SL13]|jgi:hypothetical protein|uniref:DUF3040 domain-containing protein n=1 Tax=Streptantibioticus silvisoli TaxID=2705255 RepID=A0AA90H7I1_9ACTN|nr:DUF3040 domain-containing protein [Streptantibioticus silvisoli]MDI5967648.1 DUF3040 domain-containing protein [Streptantibioticus silvisoli]MDI5971987.1 DUF3040 domain-containing protein [Streptantibioticus silvisoli]
MALSEKEGRALRAIEATLVANDPRWARQFTEPAPRDEAADGPRPHGPLGAVRPRHVVWAVLALGWVALLAVGVAISSPALTLTAIAVLLWAPLACVVATSFRS